jgi:hypothetical protein
MREHDAWTRCVSVIHRRVYEYAWYVELLMRVCNVRALCVTCEL